MKNKIIGVKQIEIPEGAKIIGIITEKSDEVTFIIQKQNRNKKK